MAKTILVRPLDTDAQAWYRCEILLTDRSSRWFPLQVLCDVKDGRNVGKPEVKGFKLSGTMGSATVGVSRAGLEAAKRLLRKAGYRIQN